MLTTDTARRRLLAATVLLAAPVHAQVDAAQQAMKSIVGLDLTSGAIVSWCETRAPNASSALRIAWKVWRNKSELDHVTGQLDAGFQRFSTPGQSSGNTR